MNIDTTRMVEHTATLAYAILVFVQCCSAANILIIGMPYYGHLAGPANVGKFLQNQGHNVRLTIPPQMKAKFENHGIPFIVYHGLGDYHESRLLREIIWKRYFGNTELHSKVIQTFSITATKIVRDVALLKSIKDFKPDLIIMDSNPVAIMLTLIPYKLDIPFIMMGSMPFPQNKRIPILPTVFSSVLLPYTDQMTFLERVHNTLVQLPRYWKHVLVNSSLIYEYVPEKPYISPIDLTAKAQLWIDRKNIVLEYNEPTMPNVKTVPHLQQLTAKPLPPEFQSFIDSADNGVVIVTFGSLLHLPSETKMKLLTAFKQTKYKYIIRDSLQKNNNSDKFMFGTWLPQFDLLRHEKTRLFISHCGSNGLQESLFAGVPIIGFPIFGDQPNNAGKVVRKGFGLKLELKSFSVQELVAAINEVITNPSYKAKVQKASEIMKSERVPPIEEAAYWINHVLMFGGEHLRSYAQDIPLWKYLGLDIIAFFFLLWHVFLYLFISLVKYCLSCCRRKTQKQKDE